MSDFDINDFDVDNINWTDFNYSEYGLTKEDVDLFIESNSGNGTSQLDLN